VADDPSLLAGGSTVFALGRTDGSITLTALTAG
jgi:hypothetical protein